MKTPQRPAFDSDVARSLEALGAKPSDPALDALADPRGAAEWLDASWRSPETERSAPADPIVLRVGRAHAAHETTYGPDPPDPAWVRIGRGSREVAVAAVGLSVAEEARRQRAERIEIELGTAACCEGATCNQNKSTASAWICLEAEPDQQSSRLLFAEARDASSERAREKVEHVAARLAKGMRLPLSAQGQTVAAESVSPPALPACDDHGFSPLAAESIARHTLRTEAGRVVLRDHASRGPRSSAWRSTGAGLLLLAIAVGLWLWTAAAVRESRTAVGVAIGAAAVLFSVAAYAFLGVARFAARYGARSSPLVWIGTDRVVVAPWVNRSGGIDLRPEGRLGAAIRLGEVRAVSVATRDGQPVVELDTEHGRIDVVSVDREDVAAFWCRALGRSIDEARHGTKGPPGGVP